MADKKKMTPEEAIQFGQQGISEVTDQQIAEQERQQQTSLLDEFRKQDQPDQVRTAINDAYESQAYDADKMITDMEISKQDYNRRAEDQQKTNKQTQLFGGITDAAASLVNIIGTTKGASPMKWDSPQQAWAQKVDQITREREEKLDKYKSDLNTLRQKRAELKSAQALAIAKYDKEKKDQDIREEKAAAEIAYKEAMTNYRHLQNLKLAATTDLDRMKIQAEIDRILAQTNKYEADLGLTRSRKEGQDKKNATQQTILDKLKEGNK